MAVGLHLRQCLKNKLKFKFKSAYFQCHSNYIPFSVLSIDCLTPTATLTVAGYVLTKYIT